MSTNDYSAGDLVEAVKGETVTRGRLKADELGLHLWVGDSGRTPENLESYGFTLSIIEKAAAVVVLPKEPGAYRDAIGNYWNLSGAGVWYGFYGESKGVQDNLPLRRLEPVSETAKKVLDRVRIILHLGRPFVMRSLDDIGEEFGVEL